MYLIIESLYRVSEKYVLFNITEWGHCTSLLREKKCAQVFEGVKLEINPLVFSL